MTNLSTLMNTAKQHSGQKTLHAIGRWQNREVKIPQGIIIPLNSVSIPDGWTRFSSADNRFIIGAGSTYSPNANGGSLNLTGIATNTTGDHTGTENTNTEIAVWAGVSQNSNYYGIDNVSPQYYGNQGSHSHSYSANYNPSQQNIILIKANSERPEFPANAIVLTHANIDPIGDLTGLFPDNRYMRGSTGLGASAQSFSGGSLSSAGSHGHHKMQPYYSTVGGGVRYFYNAFVAHSNHEISLSVSNESLTHAFLKAWSKTEAFTLKSNIIGMWEGEIPPSGWVLCDGNNSTIDLRDCFIKFGSDGNVGTKSVGTGQVTVSGSGSTAGGHDHQYSPGTGSYTRYGFYHQSTAGEHSHTISSQTKSFNPPYYALTFIMKE